MLTIKPDDPYFDLVKEFPPQKLWTLDGLRAAIAQIDKLEKINCFERTNGQDAYLMLLQTLVAQYVEEQKALLLNKCKSDEEVLRFLMVAGHLDDRNDEHVQFVCDRCGIPPANLKSVLAGTRNLSREEIIKVCTFFQQSQCLFDGSLRCGRKHQGRFHVWFGYGKRYEIRDTVTGQEVSKEPSECEVYIEDCNGQPYRLLHDSVGFTEALSWYVNENPAETLKVYFPKVWEKECLDRVSCVSRVEDVETGDEVVELQRESLAELAEAKKLVAEHGMGVREHHRQAGPHH